MSPNLFIFFVDQPVATAAFYSDLLAQAPVEAASTFCMFRLPTGAALAFWSRHTVEPAPGAAAGGAEIVFQVEDVDQTYANWVSRGLPVLQPPTEMDFGRTFVALDPDGHRLRVFRPGEEEPTGA